MLKNYEKTVDELNEYNADNKLFIGIEDFKGEDFFLDINNFGNIAILGIANSGKTVLLKSLLLQLTNKQKTMANLFLIDEHMADYLYFIKGGATYSTINPMKDMHLANVIESAYLNFKEGNPTILVIEHFDRIKEYTGKDITNIVKEMMESNNATVILLDQRINALNKLLSTKFKAHDNKYNGYFLLEGKQRYQGAIGVINHFIIKPPIVKI